MKTVGIIAEYNPFHNGHAYQIAEAKRITGADYAVVVMSGDFVQRGTPAIWDKYTRTRAALLGGADLVFELPTVYATASAEFFAEGGVALLSSLGVDFLCFGSECGNIDLLMKIAVILTDESPEFKETLNHSLRDGKTYPLAREEAVKAHCTAYGITLPDDILNHPNNLLGIEYCKAILALNSSMIPFTIKRIGDSYHESTVSADRYCSATALRALLSASTPLHALSAQVPTVILPFYQETLNTLQPVTTNDFSELLSYRLLYESADSLAAYADWNPEFANRLLAQTGTISDFDTCAATLKSKQFTLTRANRMLLHVLLHITTVQLQTAREQGSCFYARLLGLREASSKALRHLSDQSTVSVINKLAPAVKEIHQIGAELLQQDIRAAELYRMIQERKSGCILPNEYTRGIVRI